MCIILTLFTYICSKKMVHVGKYSIHGASGLWKTIEKMVLGSFFCCQLMSSNFSYLFCFFGGVVIIFFCLLTLTFSRWWFYFFYVHLYLGKCCKFDWYFSNGLKPPTCFKFVKKSWTRIRSCMILLTLNLIAVGATPAMCICIKKIVIFIYLEYFPPTVSNATYGTICSFLILECLGSPVFVAQGYAPDIDWKSCIMDIWWICQLTLKWITLLNKTFYLVHGFRSLYSTECAMATLKRTFGYAFRILRRKEKNMFMFHCLGTMSLSLLRGSFLVLYFGLESPVKTFFLCPPKMARLCLTTAPFFS